MKNIAYDTRATVSDIKMNIRIEVNLDKGARFQWPDNNNSGAISTADKGSVRPHFVP